MREPPVLTRTGWAVVIFLVLLCVTLMMTWTGCDSPIAQTLPTTGTTRVKPPRSIATAPTDIPDVAVRYRKTLVRAWQEYFSLAEPSSIGFSQIHTESRWKPTAKSPVGASGLAQAMPATADWLAELLPADVQAECGNARGCPEEPKWAIEMLAKYDYLLFKEQALFKPWEDHWAATLAAYNGGSGNIRKERALCEQARLGNCDPWRWYGHVENACIRTPANCEENRNYPVQVMQKFRPRYSSWLGE